MRLLLTFVLMAALLAACGSDDANDTDTASDTGADQGSDAGMDVADVAMDTGPEIEFTPRMSIQFIESDTDGVTNAYLCLKWDVDATLVNELLNVTAGIPGLLNGPCGSGEEFLVFSNEAATGNLGVTAVTSVSAVDGTVSMATVTSSSEGTLAGNTVTGLTADVDTVLETDMFRVNFAVGGAVVTINTFEVL